MWSSNKKKPRTKNRLVLRYKIRALSSRPYLNRNFGLLVILNAISINMLTNPNNRVLAEGGEGWLRETKISSCVVIYLFFNGFYFFGEKH